MTHGVSSGLPDWAVRSRYNLKFEIWDNPKRKNPNSKHLAKYNSQNMQKFIVCHPNFSWETSYGGFKMRRSVPNLPIFQPKFTNHYHLSVENRAILPPPPWHECAILPPLGKKSQILRIWDMTILGSGRLRRPENFAILRFFGVFSKVKVHSKCQIFLACGGLWANPSYHIQQYGFTLSVKGFWYQNAPKAQENFRF